jgi:hypothetical protein
MHLARIRRIKPDVLFSFDPDEGWKTHGRIPLL